LKRIVDSAIEAIDPRARQWLVGHWPSVTIVVGSMLLTLGLSGYHGTGRNAGFPADARAEMVAGAALVAVGLLSRRVSR
jgi:hypothetical protein